MQIGWHRVLPWILLTSLLETAAMAARAGDVVRATGHERWCKAAIAGVLASDELPDKYFGNTLVIGPGLWQQLKLDPQARGVGTPSVFAVPAGNGQQWFFFGRTLRGEAVRRLLRCAALRGQLRRVEHGEAEPASRAEREVYYALASWEIEGEPVTVVKQDGVRLLLHGRPDGQLRWVDLVSAYPLKPDATTMEEAMRKMEEMRK